MRNIKRLALCAVAIVAILAVFGMSVFAACSEHTPDAGSIKLEPNCNTIGVIEYNCLDCGETYTQKMGNLGHDYENGVCTRCGEADPDAPASSGSATTTVTTTSPKTDDSAAPLMWTAALSAAMLGACMLRRRAHN